MEQHILSALIVIAGFLLMILLALLQLREEIRLLREDGVFEAHQMEISQEDIRKIARMVLDEIKRNH